MSGHRFPVFPVGHAEWYFRLLREYQRWMNNWIWTNRISREICHSFLTNTFSFLHDVFRSTFKTTNHFGSPFFPNSLVKTTKENISLNLKPISFLNFSSSSSLLSSPSLLPIPTRLPNTKRQSTRLPNTRPQSTRLPRPLNTKPQSTRLPNMKPLNMRLPNTRPLNTRLPNTILQSTSHLNTKK